MITNKYLYLFWFEFKIKAKGMLVWVVFWTLFMLLIVAFYDSLVANSKELEVLIDALPPQLLKAFSIDSTSLTRIEGMINSRFTTFSLIIGGIWAAWTGASLVGAGEKSGKMVWLVTQPLKRTGIYLSGLGSILSWIVIVNAAVMAMTVVMVDILTSLETVPVQFFVKLGIGLTIYYIFFVGVGTLAAAVWNGDRGRNVGVMVVMSSYLLNIVKAFDAAPDFLKYFTSSFYFDPDGLARSGELGSNIWVLVIAGIIMLVAANLVFGQKDVGE